MNALASLRPMWPDPTDQERSEHMAAAWALLRGQWDAYLHQFLTEVQGDVRVAALAKLDTAINPAATFARQMSTPGLYGERPTIHAPEGGEGLAVASKKAGEPRCLLDQAGWSAQMMDVEFMCRGLGDMLVAVTACDGGLSLREVRPHDVFVVAHPDDPRRPVRLQELRQRLLGDEWIWTWDIYDLIDPEAPRFWIESAPQMAGDVRKDLTRAFLSDVPEGGFVGEGYAWRYADGTPYIPYVHYQSHREDGFWSWRGRISLHRGSYQAARLTNTAILAADSSAVPAVAVIDGKVVGADVRNDGTRGNHASLSLTPGAFFEVHSDDDKHATLQVIAGSGDALAMFSMASAYVLNLLAQNGLRGEDVTRDQANPTSAAALSIQDSTRREAQRQARDLFGPADLELLAICAALARQNGLGDFPERGYEIEYHLIPPTPAEQAEVRAQEDWDLAHGLVSPVDLYMRRHKVSEDVALRELTRIARARAELARLSASAPTPAPTT